jgi:NADPH-dependent 2,4-dienoyl-CoA reductase/sulfur reductase-like enzyme
MTGGTVNRVVVVGAGVAGIVACDQLRSAGYDGRLTVVGAEPEPPYARPPLSKDFIVGGAGGEQLELRPARWYADHGVDLRLGVAALEVSAAGAGVHLADGTFEPADAVLLATGGVARRLSVAGAEHPAVRTLRTVDDARRLKEQIRPGSRVGIVGGGLIGAEVAASAAALGADVVLIDPAPLPPARVVGAEIAGMLRRHHRELGVRLLTDAVAAVEHRGTGVVLRTVREGAGIDCDVVVVGIGMEKDTTLARAAGLAVSDGVLVDAAQRTSHPRILAAGDNTTASGSEGSRPMPGHWQQAVHQAEVAARTMLGLPAPEARAPWFWSTRPGLHLEVAGDTSGRDLVVVRGGTDAGSVLAVALVEDQCVGAVAVNRTAEMAALRRVIERRTPVSLDVLRDPAVDLRRLARGATTPAAG